MEAVRSGYLGSLRVSPQADFRRDRWFERFFFVSLVDEQIFYAYMEVQLNIWRALRELKMINLNAHCFYLAVHRASVT